MRTQQLWVTAAFLLLLGYASQPASADEPLTLEALNQADQAIAASIWHQEAIVNELKAIQYNVSLIRQASSVLYQLQQWNTYRNQQAVEWTKWRMGGGADANNNYDQAIYELMMARTRASVAEQVLSDYRKDLAAKAAAIQATHPGSIEALQPVLDALKAVSVHGDALVSPGISAVQPTPTVTPPTSAAASNDDTVDDVAAAPPEVESSASAVEADRELADQVDEAGDAPEVAEVTVAPARSTHARRSGGSRWQLPSALPSSGRTNRRMGRTFFGR